MGSSECARQRGARRATCNRATGGRDPSQRVRDAAERMLAELKRLYEKSGDQITASVIVEAEPRFDPALPLRSCRRFYFLRLRYDLRNCSQLIRAPGLRARCSAITWAASKSVFAALASRIILS